MTEENNEQTDSSEVSKDPTEVVAPEASRKDEHSEGEVTTPEDDESLREDDSDVFPRDYVEKLRDENAKLRVRAQSADDLRHRLHHELVRATGRLANPAELAFDSSHLEDPDALDSAITATLLDRPYLASRTPRGDVGQGNRGSTDQPVSLLAHLKNLV